MLSGGRPLDKSTLSADPSLVDTLGLTPVRHEQSWFKRIFWPALDDEADWHDAARHGYYACIFVCVSTLVLIVLDGSLLGGLVDIIFYGMAGLGIRQLSRLAAVSAFFLFLVERAAGLVAGRVGAFGIAGLLVAVILLNAVRAVYAARELHPAGDVEIANPPVMASSGWAGRIENLPPILWPKLRIAFRFYIAGVIAMMLLGVVVHQVGLVE